jgi:hypothetical protein
MKFSPDPIIIESPLHTQNKPKNDCQYVPKDTGIF